MFPREAEVCQAVMCRDLSAVQHTAGYLDVISKKNLY